GARDWHVYWNWEHILEQKTATKEGCPFTCPHVEKLPDYNVDMCPNTKDIMMRLGVININPGLDSEWVSATAEKLTTELEKMF
ncbi:MAG: hypothetical protein ACYTFY_19145, partial [Planctomycetota bacterium]